jgi:outer membrane biosynthesis protein TonB
MLRMVLLGLLIPLGVGVLSAMELGTPSRSAVATVQPAGETSVGISDSKGALAKADRLEVAVASSETPVQPALVEERIAPPQDIRIGSSKPPKPISRHRHDPKPKKATVAALPRSKPTAAPVKRAAIARPSKAAAGDTGLCRLKAFGGLLKALNSADCEI